MVEALNNIPNFAPEVSRRRQGVLLILAGPTAVGKNSVMDNVLQRYPQMERIISTTTRPPRENEIEGVDYHFVSREDFETRKEKGEFLETVIYGGNSYGATKADVEPILHGQDRVWIVTMPMSVEIGGYYEEAFDPTTARELKDRTLTVLVGIPRLIQLKGRSEERKDNKTTFRKRLREDWVSWQHLKEKFQDIILNETETLDKTVERVIDLLEQRRALLGNKPQSLP